MSRTKSRGATYFRQLNLPHFVSLPELPGGYGQRLNEMHDWCAQRCGKYGVAWAALGVTFRFAEEGMAEEFRREFGAGK